MSGGVSCLVIEWDAVLDIYSCRRSLFVVVGFVCGFFGLLAFSSDSLVSCFHLGA